MPGMNGFPTQETLTTEGWSIPVIFITAYGNEESRCQAEEAGAIEFLDKPFGDEQLLGAIRSALQQDKGGKATHDYSV